uniref:Uncharacterized protein n=1 Tax=Panagrolaimus davidi TaxID=227884 RepID=A0A914PLW5_9BILA
MKSGCLFSICAFLLIIQQVSAACTPDPVDKSKTCTAYCVWYTCPGLKHTKRACPADFESDCKAQTESIKFINSKNSFDLEYFSSKENVTYISGCSDAGAEGYSCMKNKTLAFEDKTEGKVGTDICFQNGEPCDSATETTANSAGSETTTPVSGSTEQNGALKLIGILAFGWMLLSAAWIQ